MTPGILTRSCKLHQKSETILTQAWKKKILPFKSILCSLKMTLIKMNPFHTYANILTPQTLSRTFSTGECIAGDLFYI